MVDLDCLSGLSEFYGGEARVNGHIDPMKTPLRQHPCCADPSKLEQFNIGDYKARQGGTEHRNAGR